MATIKILLYESKKLKNGEHPIMLRIIKDRKSKYISLGYSCNKEFWDSEKCKYKKNFPNSKNLNFLFKKREVKAEGIILKFEDEDKSYSLEEFEKAFRGIRRSTTVFKYFDERIERLINSGKIGNSRVYKDTKRVISKYRNGKDLQFSDIDYRFLKKLEEYQFANGNSGNTISVYMRTLRSLYNQAIKEGYCKDSDYPFKNYNISELEVDTLKRAISIDDMRKIIDHEIEPCSILFNEKNYFLFSFYNMGMNFIDIALLKWENITNGRIEYARSKTSKRYTIKLLPQTEEILNHYKNNSHKSNYVFPILNSGIDEGQIQSRIKNARGRFNEKLKLLAKEVGIDTNLTSYVARHSWASILRRNGISTSIISDGLRHGSLKTTEIYLDSFINPELDEANEGII